MFAQPHEGIFGTGDAIGISVHLNRKVAFNGTLALQLALDDAVRPAAVAVARAMAGGALSAYATVVHLEYVVEHGAHARYLDYSGANALTHSGGTLVDVDGLAVNLTLPAPRTAESLTADLHWEVGAPLLGSKRRILIDGSAPEPAPPPPPPADPAPAATGVVFVPGHSSPSGAYSAGDVVAFHVAFTAPVHAVCGTSLRCPAVRMNTGREAAYAAGNGTAVLEFAYVVDAADAVGALDYRDTRAEGHKAQWTPRAQSAALGVYDGRIQGASGEGKAATFLPLPGAAGSLAAAAAISLESAAPTIVGVTASAATPDGVYGTDGEIGVRVHFSRAVSLVGDAPPFLDLALANVDDATATAPAAYVSGNNTYTLDFAYRVRAGDLAARLDVVAGRLGGTTVLRASAAPQVPAVLDLPAHPPRTAIAPLSLVGSGHCIAVQTAQFFWVERVYLDVPWSGVPVVRAGAVVVVAVEFGEPVRAPGDDAPPTLALQLDGGAVEAVFSGMKSPTTMLFSYTVAGGDAAACLEYASVDALAAGRCDAALATADGAPVAIKLPSPGGPRSISAARCLQVETPPPRVVAVAVVDTAPGTYGVGQEISITAQVDDWWASEATVTPQMALDDLRQLAAPSAVAPANGTVVFTVTYVVLAGDATAALGVGTVFIGAVSFPPEKWALGAIEIETSAPYVVDVTTSAVAAVYTEGDAIPLTVRFSAPVTAAGGNATLLLTAGGRTVAVEAAATPEGGSAELSFAYVVAADDETSRLEYTGVAGLELPSGATLRRSSTTPTTDAVLALPLRASPRSLLGSSAVVVDTKAVRVASVGAVSPPGRYGVGARLTLAVTFSHAVVVVAVAGAGDAPQLLLAGGMVATYVRGSGSDTLEYEFDVAPGDAASPLEVSSVDALRRAGGHWNIRSGGILRQHVALSVQSGVLPAAGIVVDTRPATIVGVTADGGAGAADGAAYGYGTGAEVAILVEFSDAVHVPDAAFSEVHVVLDLGCSFLEPDRKGSVHTSACAASPLAVAAPLVGGNGTSTLRFLYTVAEGHAARDLDLLGVGCRRCAASGNPRHLSDCPAGFVGTVLRDSTAPSQPAVLATPCPGAAGSLSLNGDVVIDTAPPRALFAVSTRDPRAYSVGESIDVHVVFDKPVALVGTGVPLLRFEPTAPARGIGADDAAVALWHGYPRVPPPPITCECRTWSKLGWWVCGFAEAVAAAEEGEGYAAVFAPAFDVEGAFPYRDRALAFTYAVQAEDGFRLRVPPDGLSVPGGLEVLRASTNPTTRAVSWSGA